MELMKLKKCLMDSKAQSKHKLFLDDVFQHILSVSNGESTITDSDLEALESEEEKRNILAGLKLLHEDLELYKREYKQKLDAEYQLRILQKKNEELEQFNYMASHDLKEPLRSIISFSALLMKDVDSLPTDTIQTYLSFISDSGLRMYQLIDGLLHFSVAGEEFNKTKVDPNELIEILKADLHALINNTNIEFEVSRLPYINADSTSIRLIFQNLISNAIKFSSRSKKLKIKVDSEMEKDFHYFYVSDNGPGIEKEYHEKVFSLLTRLQPKSEVEGAGIGLSICKKLIAMHGGEIWLDPDYVNGARFIFTIPRTIFQDKGMIYSKSVPLNA